MKTAISHIPFVKMSGAGNDFVLVDNRDGRLEHDWKALATSICDRRSGVGADGLLVLQPDNTNAFSMLYFNSDGSHGSMCGNGGRCAAELIFERENTSRVSFEALAFLYTAESIRKQEVKLYMKDSSEADLGVTIDLGGIEVVGHFIDTGSPHFVVFLEDQSNLFLEKYENEGVESLGRELRFHEQFFPHGANINFVRVHDQLIIQRTYERGVEQETLACGTGSIASAIIASSIKGISPPVKVSVRSQCVLIVDFKKHQSNASEISLTGQAKLIFEGIFRYTPRIS